MSTADIHHWPESSRLVCELCCRAKRKSEFSKQAFSKYRRLYSQAVAMGSDTTQVRIKCRICAQTYHERTHNLSRKCAQCKKVKPLKDDFYSKGAHNNKQEIQICWDCWRERRFEGSDSDEDPQLDDEDLVLEDFDYSDSDAEDPKPRRSPPPSSHDNEEMRVLRSDLPVSTASSSNDTKNKNSTVASQRRIPGWRPPNAISSEQPIEPRREDPRRASLENALPTWL
ncbi:hypothetical protein IE53DRAFT_360498 [Violaceomyces palustris]|uniref:Uncharacterized protein n=1 Tax=Violaceomyces palustris TaxID=1673888 RepID=A0ACD0P475_9BASI|nr:hypothetical protein IE53DRAFT_360498 [Violaceomyces palustris]